MEPKTLSREAWVAFVRLRGSPEAPPEAPGGVQEPLNVLKMSPFCAKNDSKMGLLCPKILQKNSWKK